MSLNKDETTILLSQISFGVNIAAKNFLNLFYNISLKNCMPKFSIKVEVNFEV